MKKVRYIKPLWRKLNDGSWQALAVLSVCGIIKKAKELKWDEGKEKWYWEARVMCDCRNQFTGPAISGKANSLEGAKRIVETLLEETDTLERRGE